MAYKKYEESDAVKQAKANLEAQLSQKPGEHTSQWQTQLNDTLNKIQNREKFAYNINGDALYNQYKDKFVRQGQQAMQDTMGQAAALTGGYGSTYGQNVGQQAYNAYLQNLNDIVPDLYNQAYNRYQDEGNDLLNMYSLLGQNEAQDYGRWQDSMNAFYNERDYLTNLYNAERDLDYGRYRDDVSDWQWAQSFYSNNNGGNTPVSNPTMTIGSTTSDPEMEAGEYESGYAANNTVVRQVLALLNNNTEASDEKAMTMLGNISSKLTAAQKKEIAAYLNKKGYEIEW